MDPIDGTPTADTSGSKRALGLLRTALGWFLSSVLGGALGAWAISYVERPAPDAVIDRMEITVKYNARFGNEKALPVPMDKKLFQELTTSSIPRRVPGESAEHPADSLAEEIEALKGAEDYSKLMIREMSTLRPALPKLRNYLLMEPNQRSADAFFDEWMKVDRFINLAIDRQIQLGLFSHPPEKSYDNSPTFFNVDLFKDVSPPGYTVSNKSKPYISSFLGFGGNPLYLATAIAISIRLL
jgi:hypothetical protein